MKKALAFGILNCAMVAMAHADQRIPAGVLAASSDTFLSSLGVCTHVDQGYDPGAYVLPLRYLGVRNIRDSERNLSGHLMLHKQTGILRRSVGRRCEQFNCRGEDVGASRRAAFDRGTKRTQQLPDHLQRTTRREEPTMNWLPGWLPGWLLDWLPGWLSWIPVASFRRISTAP